MLIISQYYPHLILPQPISSAPGHATIFSFTKQPSKRGNQSRQPIVRHYAPLLRASRFRSWRAARPGWLRLRPAVPSRTPLRKPLPLPWRPLWPLRTRRVSLSPGSLRLCAVSLAASRRLPVIREERGGIGEEREVLKKSIVC